MHQQPKFLKILWEKEKLLLYKQFLHFPQCFLLNQIIVSPFVHIFDIISLVAFELEEPKIGISGKGLKKYDQSKKHDFYGRLIFLLWFNPFPNKPWFLPVCSISLLKTLWEKEKLLVTSNFSFSHSVFYSFWELFAIFIKFEIVVCKSFQFGRA